METYLQEITKLMSLRLKERTLAALKESVSESVQEKITQSRQQVVDELRKNGVTDELSVNAAIKTISATVTQEYLRTEGPALLSKAPAIIQAEAIKLGEELALAVKDATLQAASEVTQELSSKNN